MEEKLSEYVPWYRRKTVLIITAAVAACVIIAITAFFIKSKFYFYTDNAIIDGQKISVSAGYSGNLLKLAAREGSYVKKGEIIASLDDRELKAEENDAKETILYDLENVKLAELALEKANNDFNSSGILYKNGAIARTQFEDAQINLKNAGVTRSMADIQAASAKARLNEIETRLGYMEISAPCDGIIAKKWASEGELVQPGELLYTIYDLHNVTALANIEETSLMNVHEGQDASVNIDAYPGRKFTGKVSSIAPCTVSQLAPAQMNNSTGDFTKVTQYVSVRIMLDGVNGNGMQGRFPVLPGMSAEVTLKE